MTLNIDLTDCLAKLEWADREFAQLSREVERIFREDPVKVVTDYVDDTGLRTIRIDGYRPLPKIVRVSIGQIISSQRDALDYLAVALARRNGASNVNGVYFPIAKSKEIFLKSETQRKIKMLSDEDREKICSLEPFLEETIYFLV